MSTLKEERRHEILSAAAAVFIESGFEKAKIEDIAARAGIGKSTVYEYFPSKMDIFTNLLHDAVHAFIDELRVLAQVDIPFREKLLRYAKLHSALLSENYQAIFTYAQIALRRHDEISDMLIAHRTLIDKETDEILQSAIARGELRQDLTIVSARYLIQAPLTALALDRMHGWLENPDETAEKIVDSLLTGLKA